MKNSAILLVNPNRMRPSIAPIGLEYVAESLARQGIEPVVCDLAFAEDWRRVLEDAIEDVKPDAIGVTVRNIDDAYFASQDFILEKTKDVVGAIRDASRAPITLGGIGFSIAPKEILRYTGVDYGIAGDGEESLPALLSCLRENGDPAGVPGVAYRVNGDVRARPPATCDVSALPPFTRSCVDHPRYFVEGGQAGIETKRGCNRSCIYCIEPAAKGSRLRLRPPDAVVQEVAALVDRGINVFHLCDSEFNIPPDHADAVCAALVQSGLAARVRWYTYASPVPFDRDLARNMARAGCVGINFGVDHADEGMLRRLGRNYLPDDIRRTAVACRTAGITVMFDTLFGGPGETRETIGRAVQFMRDVDADRVGLSCGIRVYPNTTLAYRVKHQGPLYDNPHLHGAREDNDDLLKPIFYVDAAVGGAVHEVVWNLVGGDHRFLAANPAETGKNYNYNDNSVLMDAIRAGERGAYWDILRRLDEGNRTTTP